MKKYSLLILVASVVFFSGCQTAGGGNPKDVLKHFFDSISRKDFNDAKKYATKDSEGMLSMMEMGMQSMNNEHGNKMMEMVQNVEMGDAAINGESATVNVKDKKTGESTDFLLKKEGGDWKVAFDMSTLMEMANQKMKEHALHDMDTMNGETDSGKIRNEKNIQAKRFMDSVMDSIRLLKEKKLK